MPNPNDPLAQQLARMGVLSEEKDYIQRQIEQAQALRNRPTQKFATWGGTVAGGIGDLLRQVSGGIHEGQLAEALAQKRGEQEHLTGEATRAASAFPGEWSALAAMPEGSERTKLESDLLRRQQAFGMAAQASGDPRFTQLGQSLLADVKAQPEAQRRAREEMELRDPNTPRGALVMTMAQKYGFTPQAGATPAQVQPLLPLMEKSWQAEQEMGGKRDAATLAADKRRQEVAEGLRKEFVGNPVVKATQEVATAYQKIKGAMAKPSAAGDMSLIFSYMKALDPGSTVREGEYATAQNAGSIDQRILGMYNAAVNGKKLADSVRKDFFSQAGNLVQAQMERYQPVAAAYTQLATRANIDPTDVVLDFGLGAPTQAAAPSKLSAEDEAAIQAARIRLQVNPNDAIAQEVLRLHGMGK